MLLGLGITASACGQASDGTNAHRVPEAPQIPRSVNAAEVVIEPNPARAKPPFSFSDTDQVLLDEIQRGALAYFIHATDPVTGMAYDRSSADTISIAGVGYQLAALAIGAERDWIGRDDAELRARTILRALLANPDNRKRGLFYHFLNPGDASPRRIGTELVVSTVDSAILFAGAIVAGEYFGGPVEDLTERMIRDADWTFFQNHKVDFERGDSTSPDMGFLSLGWRPKDDNDPTGSGDLIPYSWVDSGDEHRLVTLMAVCAPNPEHRVPPEIYYNLRRQIGINTDAPEDEQLVVWFPYSGALFTAFFSHCWVDYARLGVDNPGAFGVAQRASVDWWENSRRLVNLHRDKAIRNPEQLPTLGANAWGLSACDGPDGYIVPGVYPEPVEMAGAVFARDFTNHRAEDRWGGGVVAPYAAGSSIVFEPQLALAALRQYRAIEGPRPDGTVGALAWHGAPDEPAGPGAEGLYGLVDAYRAPTADEPAWIASDTVAIDHGPLIVLIENARSGLVWSLFHRNEAVREGLERLGLWAGTPIDSAGDTAGD